ncbi:anthranilate synthase component I family protein [Flavicella marina]|uniref:anthranilate synthase component I family protein n=1 Tax=Flavicella marina TaxID=1475951 RepID=UPI001264D4BC|nr:anthranilate synthase component I family protein [Flavicella marina]
MKRVKARYTTDNPTLFKRQLLDWSQQFETLVWLDSNEHQEKYAEHEAILAFEPNTSIKTSYKNAFDKLKTYHDKTKDYLFGYLGYDLKNDIEDLNSNNRDVLDFPDLFFFQPKKIIFISGHSITFEYLTNVAEEISADYEKISSHEFRATTTNTVKTNINLRIPKDTYIEKVNRILDNIHYGDLYEVTFCQEFYAENSTIDPLQVYSNLNKISKPPFATFLKQQNHFLLSASPERYLKKIGKKVISQPIKGTAKRSNSFSEDTKLKSNLEQDPKERAENIMIVDLVRNDLSRISEKGSTKVEELCGIYSFKQVHQMISTISTSSPIEAHPVDIIKNTFPMGSMTGAPKISAMEIIEKEEESKRGLYSGSVGYFAPNGNFDFNVVIRSILYNAKKKYISFSVGSAITSLATPEKELEECLLKAKAMREVLG